jgi:hypothetical protein
MRFAAVALVALAAVAAAAASAATRISDHGLARLPLGTTLARARATGLIGRTGPGCELASPRPLVAPLRRPLVGSATFSGTAPHRLVSLEVRRGAATARGVGIGATTSAVRHAYPAAQKVYAKPGDPLQLFALVLRSRGRDRISFMLGRRDGRVVSIDVPSVQACE